MVCVHQEPCTSRDTLQCPGHRSLGGSPGGGVCLSLSQVLLFRAGREKERAPNFPGPQSIPQHSSMEEGEARACLQQEARSTSPHAKYQQPRQWIGTKIPPSCWKP